MIETGNEVFLFTTKTCPNCPVAIRLLNEANISFETIDAQENMKLARQYKIMQAPTLLVKTKTGYQTYPMIANIKKYIMDIQK